MCKGNCRVIGRKYWCGPLRGVVSAFIELRDACAKMEIRAQGCGAFGRYFIRSRFLDTDSLDVVGPLPVTKKGNRYLLTFIDLFTLFCEAIPIAMQNTETIAREFVIKIITQFGVPQMLLTDRGASFTSAMITDIQID
jgi:transposase InsO family protein